MTAFAVADDQLGAYYRKTAAIGDRLGKSLPFEQVIDALQRIHDGQFDTASVLVRPDFKIWRTVKYSGKDAAGYRKSFKAKGINLGTYANQILDKVQFPAVGTEMDIV